jgi:hypothetical protein
VKKVVGLGMVLLLGCLGLTLSSPRAYSSAQPGWRDCISIKGYNCRNKTTDGCEAERLERCAIQCRAGDPIDCEEIMGK